MQNSPSWADGLFIDVVGFFFPFYLKVSALTFYPLFLSCFSRKSCDVLCCSNNPTQSNCSPKKCSAKTSAFEGAQKSSFQHVLDIYWQTYNTHFKKMPQQPGIVRRRQMSAILLPSTNANASLIVA